MTALQGIIDPCSVSAGVRLSIWDLGLIQEMNIGPDGCVQIRLLPTFPGCHFVGIFEEEIRDRLSSLDWCSDVKVDIAPPNEIWNESHMASEARERLMEVRRRRRAEALEHTGYRGA